MSEDFVAALAEVAARVVTLAQGDEPLRSGLRALARAFLAVTEPPELSEEPHRARPAPVEPEDATPPPRLGPDAAKMEGVELVGAGPEGAGAPPLAPAANQDAERPPVDARATVESPAGPSDRPLLRPANPLKWQERVGVPFSPAGKANQVVPAGDWPEVTDADLPLVEKRLRLKAEGSRWSAARRRRLAEGADYRLEIEPLDRELIEKAKVVPDCFLWMNHPSGPAPADLSVLDDLAGCFDATADAVALVRGILGDALGDAVPDREALEQSLELLAEAQSALRSAVERADGRPDKDQLRAYQWLRATCARLNTFIQRHMKAEDPADPTSWPGIDRRLDALDARLQAVRDRGRRFQSCLKRVRYHLKPILESKGVGVNGSAARDVLHDWRTIIDTVDQMVRDGVPPSNADLRELLLPVIDMLPEVDVPAGFGRVVREMDRFVASRPPAADEAAAAATVAAPNAEVAAAAQLLRGKTVVLIGGMRRPEACEALKAVFELKELDWVETREHGSVTVFEPHVARPDVALVVLVIRWSSHAFGEVKQYCDRYGKPLVRLPAGYNPNQVAAQVMAQCSGRLAGS